MKLNINKIEEISVNEQRESFSKEDDKESLEYFDGDILESESIGLNEQNERVRNGDHSLLEIIEEQKQEIDALKQSVLILQETVSKILYEQNERNEDILSLQQRVEEIECGNFEKNGYHNSEHEEVRNWMTKIVKLEQYYHILIDNGFEDMLSIKTLTKDILDDIEGIDKIGHKSKILYFVQKLSENQTNLDSQESTHEF